MKLQVKPATPWNVTLAKLQSLELKVAAEDRSAMEARWSFGRELMNRRIDYKGKLGVPRDLMTLTMKQCELSKAEINKRIRFAERYMTKNEMCNAVTHYPSWHRMTHEGLVEKKHEKKKASVPHPPKRTIRKLAKELEQAFARHATLTRDDVKDIERLLSLLQTILEQVDRNDLARVS